VPSPFPILSVGHSLLPAKQFVALLLGNSVSLVLDVRSSPFSSRAPQYNRDALNGTLADQGISYVTAGHKLGGRPKNPHVYVSGQVQYEKLAETPDYRSGLRKLLSAARKQCVVLLCAEADPIECHRFLLISRSLADLGHQVRHIHHDGRVESQRQAEDRMLRQAGLSQSNLFAPGVDALATAYAAQSSRFAFVQAPKIGPG
jgi:uncharacterized protein (DUF488 family)